MKKHENKGEPLKPDNPKPVYQLVIDVYDNGTSKMQATMPNIHPASVMLVLSNLISSVATNVITQAQKEDQKIKLIRPDMLPKGMKLVQ